MLGYRFHLGHRSDGDPFGVAPLYYQVRGMLGSCVVLPLSFTCRQSPTPSRGLTPSDRLLVALCGVRGLGRSAFWSFVSGSSEVHDNDVTRRSLN